jgi:cytochrome P450
VRGVAHKVIAERRKMENWREVKDLLTLLMKSQDSESGEGLSDDQIAIELEVFISAGHETTAHCIDPTYLLLSFVWLTDR